MEDKQNKRRIISYLLCFTLACLVVLGVTYARYKSSVSGTGTATTAKVALNSKADLSNALKNMKPGESRLIDVSVSNKNPSDGKISEVTQDYTITVKTTGNLPLEFRLTAKNFNAAGIYVNQDSPDKGDNSVVWSGGQMPHSDIVTHDYTLSVKWTESEKDSAYADEIDKITLAVDAEQTQQ